MYTKQDQPGSPLFCHNPAGKFVGMDETLDEEIYGLAGIAFDTYGTGSDMVTKFINVQSHRKWIDGFKWSILEEKDKLELWSISEKSGKKIEVLQIIHSTQLHGFGFMSVAN